MLMRSVEQSGHAQCVTRSVEQFGHAQCVTRSVEQSGQYYLHNHSTIIILTLFFLVAMNAFVPGIIKNVSTSIGVR